MKKNNVFWVSYSDLLSSLFFIMLVLFVITVSYLKIIQQGLVKTIEEQNKLLQLEKLFRPLEKNTNFIYLPECKKYIAKDLIGVEIFLPFSSDIKKEFENRTYDVGLELESFIKDLNAKNPEFSYLLIIEGNMANRFDKSISIDNDYGYKKSYERALAVYNLWNEKSIDLRQYNVEVLICGSGFNGLCRDQVEENNKRFSIQIVPKVQNRITK